MKTLGLTPGYVSGDPLAGWSLFEATTLAALGIEPGLYVFGLANGQTIAVVAGRGTAALPPAAVPLPGALPLLAGALLALGALARRRT